MDEKKVYLGAWVLWWKYLDGSGEEIIRVYAADGVRAHQDFELVKEDTVRAWKLDEVPFVA